MTALAMIIGMLPMALGLGEGGEQNAPLGRAVIGGLLVATVFTLFVVPVMYSSAASRATDAADRDSGGTRMSTRLVRRSTLVVAFVVLAALMVGLVAAGDATTAARGRGGGQHRDGGRARGESGLRAERLHGDPAGDAGRNRERADLRPSRGLRRPDHGRHRLAGAQGRPARPDRGARAGPSGRTGPGRGGAGPGVAGAGAGGAGALAKHVGRQRGDGGRARPEGRPRSTSPPRRSTAPRPTCASSGSSRATSRSSHPSPVSSPPATSPPARWWARRGR